MLTHLDHQLKEITDNLLPEDVFTDEQLTAWAQRHKEPQDIFTFSQLKTSINDIKNEHRYESI